MEGKGGEGRRKKGKGKQRKWEGRKKGCVMAVRGWTPLLTK